MRKRRMAMTPVAFTRGLSVSPLGFGGAEIGNLHRAVSEQQAQETLHAAAALGVTFFDTAPSYGNGLSELRIGHFLRSRPRGSYVLSTKVGAYMVAPEAGPARSIGVFASPLPFKPVFDYSYDGTMRALEQSRLRLGLLRPDIVFIHDLDRRNHGDAWPEQMRIARKGAFRALDELRRNGDIGAAGIAVNEADIGTTLLREWDFDCALMAGCYTLLDRTAEASFLPAARTCGVAVIAASVFHSGLLAGGPTFNYAAPPPEILQRVKLLETLCGRHAISLAGVALQFVARHPGISSIAVGASRPQTMQRTMAALTAPVPSAFWMSLPQATCSSSTAKTPCLVQPSTPRLTAAKNGIAPMPQSVLNDAFFDSFSTSVLSSAEAESLPPACYVDAEFFAFEKQALFYKEWLCVGRESWVRAPGDYFTSKHVGEPIVVTRTRDGEVAAMSAVCQHRGMVVAEGHGNVRNLLCPYHHWGYSLTGELLGAPEMGRTCNFDKSKYGLPRLRVEIWHGFIFINFDLDAPALTPQLTALEDIMANYDMASLDGPRPAPAMRLNWNWKVMLENNNDGYHANRLHHGPLHDPVPSHLARFPDLPDDTGGYYRTNGSTHPHASFNPTQKALLPIFPKLTEEEQNRVAFVNVPPSFSLVMNSDMVIYMFLQAEDADHHSVVMGNLVMPHAMENPMFEHLMKFNHDSVSEIVSQDLHVDEMVQQGLKSKFAPRGRYSWQEGAQRQFNLWLVNRYRKAWESSKKRALENA